MNSIISLPKLIELLAKASSKDKAFCEKFISVFSNEVGEALSVGGSLKIKGFGQFKVTVADTVRRIVFIPDRELADAVNAPFACFDPVALAPGVSEEVLAAADDEMTDSEAGNILKVPEPDSDVNNTESDVPSGSPQLSIDSQSDNDTEIKTTVPADVPPAQDASTGGLDGETLVIDFGFDVHSDEPIDDIDDGSTRQPYDLPAEDICQEATADSVDVTMDSDRGGRAGKDFESDEDYASNQTADRASGDILDSPEPWAAAHEDEMPLNGGLNLLKPEARKRMQERESKDKVRSSAGSCGFPWFWVAIAYIGGMAIGFALGFFGHDYVSGLKNNINTENLTGNSDDTESSDSRSEEDVLDLTDAGHDILDVDEVETVPVDTDSFKASADSSAASVPADSIKAHKLGDAPVYDTITPKVNLNSLAQKHYGNKVYWVYIFLDNQDKIKNPNNVIVGTKLRIPPKQQYDVSETDEKANIEAAFRKQSEIYKKYDMH